MKNIHKYEHTSQGTLVTFTDNTTQLFPGIWEIRPWQLHNLIQTHCGPIALLTYEDSLSFFKCSELQLAQDSLNIVEQFARLSQQIPSQICLFKTGVAMIRTLS